MAWDCVFALFSETWKMCGNTALYNIWDTRFVFAGML